MLNRRQLVKNGSFEVWTPKGFPARWSAPFGSIKRSSDCSHGIMSVELQPNQDDRGTVVQQKIVDVGALAGKALQFSAAAKSLDPDQLRVSLFYTVKGERHNFGRKAQGLGEWEQLSLSKEFPEDADPDVLLVKVHLMPKAKYAALVDNIRVIIGD